MFAIGWLAYLLLGMGFAAIAFALFAPNRERHSDGADNEDPAASGPFEQRLSSILEHSLPEPGATTARIAWTSLVDGSEAEVPLDARIRMLEGLGSLGGSWCGPILVAAYLEEKEPQAREAALCALSEARYHDCNSVLGAALHSPRVIERVLAVDLADAIDELDTLDAALTDPEVPVATAAAYALRKRMNGSLLAHLEEHVSQDRTIELLSAIRLLT